MKYIVNGGNKLFGRISVDAAKNSILPVIAATIMCDEECVIKDIPLYLDVIEMSAILEKLGKKVEVQNGNFRRNQTHIRHHGRNQNTQVKHFHDGFNSVKI